MVRIWVLTIIPIIPAAIQLVHFFVNGGLQWPMTWANEVTAWGVLLLPAVIPGLIISMKSRKYSQAILPCIVLAYVLLSFIMYGFDASSKSDADTLELIQFWTSQWGYW